MKSLKLKILPETTKDGSVSFDSVSALEKSGLYDNVSGQLNHRVVFCHPATAADAGLTPLQPVCVKMFNIECRGKKILAEHPQSCFVVVTLHKLPRNIAFVSQQGIVQHLLVPCSSACCLQEHLTRARVAVSKVRRLVPAHTISLQPDFDYDSGVSRQTCKGTIMHMMKVENAPYSGHPFLFTESSRIFIGNVLSRRYLTVTSVTSEPENSVHPILTLGSDGTYDAEPDKGLDWEKLFCSSEESYREKDKKKGTCDRAENKLSAKTRVADDRLGSLTYSNDNGDAPEPCHFSKNAANCTENTRENKRTHDNVINVMNFLADNSEKCNLGILNAIGNEEIPCTENERILTSPANTPIGKASLSMNITQMLETPKSQHSRSKAFVHSISRSSLSAFESSLAGETDSSVVNKTRDLLDEEDSLTLYYITSETSVVLQSMVPSDDEDGQTSVRHETENFCYNPQVEVLAQKLSTCLSLLREIGARDCVGVQCGVVVHGAPADELELLATRAAEQLGLYTVTALCDLQNRRELAALYASARRRSPAVVLLTKGDVALCQSRDERPNPAISALLEVLRTVRESRSAVVTVCLCNTIEKLSTKVRKALGFDVHNALSDVRIRETIIRKFLEHEGCLVQTNENDCQISISSSSALEISEEFPREVRRNPFSSFNFSLEKSSESLMSNPSACSIDRNVYATSTSPCENKVITPQCLSESELCTGTPRAMRCRAEDVVALGQVTEYCSCAEVLEVVHLKLEAGSMKGGLPTDFAPHLLTASTRDFVPPTRWGDILGYASLKAFLQRMVRQYREDPERCPLQGLLLYGPPGCSKTMFVKALATETGFSYFLVLGSVVLSKYVGETEQRLRDVVQRAKAAAPSIVFIDELESLCGDRGGGSAGAPVALLLELMSSCAPTPQDPLTGVLFVGATNMPHLLDEGLLQAGYLSHVVHVGLPDCASRCALWHRILSLVAWKDDDIDVRQLCCLTEGFSGAEIHGVYNEAGHKLIRSLSAPGAGQQKVSQDLLVDTITTASSRIPASLLAAIDDFTASRSGVIEAC